MINKTQFSSYIVNNYTAIIKKSHFFSIKETIFYKTLLEKLKCFHRTILKQIVFVS